MPPKTGVRWEWQNDADVFAQFDTVPNRRLEEAYQKASGKGSVEIDHSGWRYEFNFDKMTQTNLETKKVRTLKRNAPFDLKVTAWQWKNDRNAWVRYDPELNSKLEDEFQKSGGGSGAKLLARIAGQDYTIRFDTMQQINNATGKIRDIERISEEEPPRKRQKTEASASTGGSHPRGVVKVLKKGRGVVDVHSGMTDKTHIYETPTVVYQCTLNQTNIGENNNKFYIIQLLESDKGDEWWLWTRWGRVGVAGQSALDRCLSLPSAIEKYCKKFRDKTSNDWTGNPDDFTKVPGKYQLMRIDYDEGASAPAAAVSASAAGASSIPSTLSVALQQFMKMIGSTADMERAMKELEIDTTKMPLGKISKKQIKEGFQILKEIEKELNKRKGSPDRSILVNKTSLFYTLIPHDFGFSMPPLISDLGALKRKMDLLEVLSDLEVATKLLVDAKSLSKNPLDASYEKLKCEMIPLSKTDEVFARICTFVSNTHGKTHIAYKLEVLEIFAVNRDGEAEKFKRFAGLGNRMMLWHGSRTTNYMGILSQGLRIAPPEAPVTGYMFGKGVYFADVATKSANYCHTSPSSNEGVLLLCDVALGKSLELMEAKNMDYPVGHNSTKGLGKMAPNDAESVVVDGAKWPMGHMTDTSVTKTTLLYNEYVVYDVSQIQIKFVVKCKFRYRV